ncbi:MAG TPA: DUF1592 domain-containing protein [Fimbriiglobus sp.]|nr:DUF1592 domain-containing protein [Fimbriiglobus sp.]
MPIRSRLAWAALAPVAALALCATDRRAGPQALAADPPADKTFERKVVPLLTKYCFACHNSDKQKGGVALDAYRSEALARKDRMTWETVRKVVADGHMPPKKKPHPTREEKALLLGWIENTLSSVDCTGPQDPGRVTLRRLNRTEYNNTVRDLCGVTITPADAFPADDVGYGFDNIGDVLSLQPILLEKYLAAADRVLEAAIPPLGPVPTTKQGFRAQNIQTIPRSARIRVKRNDRPRIVLTTEGEAYLEKFNFPATGEYTVRVRAWGAKADGKSPELTIRVNGRDVKTLPVDAPKDKPAVYQARTRVEAGERRVAAAFANPTPEAKEPRSLGIELIEIEGPFGKNRRPIPESAKRLIVAVPDGPADAADAARKIVAEFARRAFRRPVKPAEVERLMTLYALAESKGEPFEKAIRLPLKAVLVSPHFLFRIEDDPKEPGGVRTLDDFELATRLSYFLWSSMPDEELFALAGRGELSKPGVLKVQIDRMLKDPKSSALVENFAGQWLQLRNLKTVSPDPGTFHGWDDDLRAAMAMESELFFEYVVKNDRSVLEFLDADYTFVNERLAKHYGIPKVYGRSFRRVKLPDNRRGGVVTQASVLTVTSNPTRTSPVKRGKWVYENILGLTAPPPAPDVPELPPVGQLKGTLRQQMEQHRANPSCATCHAKLDPLGFGLENFNGIGAWRDKDNNLPVDATGVLPDGNKFDGPAELRKVLLGKADQFRRCLAEKLMTYALGRGLEYYDKCALDEVTAKLKSGNDRFSALVLAIAESDAFRKRKGQRRE